MHYDNGCLLTVAPKKDDWLRFPTAYLQLIAKGIDAADISS